MSTIIITQGREDGTIRLSGPSWPPTNPYCETSGVILDCGPYYDKTNYYIYRSYLRFNCSQISQWATVISAKLWLKASTKYNFDNFNIQLLLYKVDGDWYPLDTGDWGCGKTLIATKNFADIPASGKWFSIDIPPSQINKGGITAFEIRSDHESGVAPTYLDDVTLYSADSSGSEPYLEINYNPPPGSGRDVPIIAGG
jgi:hypothetical protein